MELEIRWEDDWDLGCSHAQFYCEEAYPNGEPTTCETCMVLSEGVVLASLGCIDDATPEYRKFIESELLDEAKGVRSKHVLRLFIAEGIRTLSWPTTRRFDA